MLVSTAQYLPPTHHLARPPKQRADSLSRYQTGLPKERLFDLGGQQTITVRAHLNPSWRCLPPTRLAVQGLT